MSLHTQFYFKPGENERIETSIHLCPEYRSAIHGVVLDLDEKPVSEALVLLFDTDEQHRSFNLIAQVFTDQEGQFVFGPLESDKNYMVRIFKNMLKLRQLNIHANTYDF